MTVAMLAKRNATREDLQLAASGSRIPGVEHVHTLPVPDAGYIGLVWPSDGGAGLPVVVVVGGQPQQVDFLAWAATYLDAFSPLTAYCRVVQSGIERWHNPSAQPDRALVAAAVALVLTEVGAFSRMERSPTVRDCFATYSYALGRALVLGWRGPVVSSVRDGYLGATARYDHGDRDSQARQVGAAWAALLGVVGINGPGLFPHSGKERLVEAVHELYSGRALSQTSLSRLSSGLRVIEDVAKLDAMPMEDRVIFFRALADEVGARAVQSPELALLLGYVLSRVSGGTLDHYRLVEDASVSAAGVLQWYALCVGLCAEQEIVRLGSNAIAPRVWRELVRPFDFLARPRCDASWDELALYSDRGVSGWPGSLRGLSSAVVELAPGVEVTLSGGTQAAGRRHMAPNSRDDPRSDPYARLGFHLGEAQEALAELRRGGKKGRGSR